MIIDIFWYKSSTKTFFLLSNSSRNVNDFFKNVSCTAKLTFPDFKKVFVGFQGKQSLSYQSNLSWFMASLIIPIQLDRETNEIWITYITIKWQLCSLRYQNMKDIMTTKFPFVFSVLNMIMDQVFKFSIHYKLSRFLLLSTGVSALAKLVTSMGSDNMWLTLQQYNFAEYP